MDRFYFFYYSSCSSITSSLISTYNHKRILKMSLTAAVFFCFLIGASRSIPSVTVSALCFFLSLPFINTSIEVLLRKSIDHEIQGRIWSLISFITQTGMLSAMAVTGFLADKIFNPMSSNSYFTGIYFGTRSDTGSSIMIASAGILMIIINYFSWIKINKQNLTQNKTQTLEI